MHSTQSNDVHIGTAQLLEFAAQSRFHQRFELPATANHGPLAVTYADIGPRQTEDAGSNGQDNYTIQKEATPTILLIQGMAGTRLFSCLTDHLANKIGVRILIIDR